MALDTLLATVLLAMVLLAMVLPATVLLATEASFPALLEFPQSEFKRLSPPPLLPAPVPIPELLEVSELSVLHSEESATEQLTELDTPLVMEPATVLPPPPTELEQLFLVPSEPSQSPTALATQVQSGPIDTFYVLSDTRIC
jgi:hypothetical protein